MPTLKFSQFTTVATVSPTSTFFVGYDEVANVRFRVGDIQLQTLGGQLDASTQLIGTINTGGATSITLGTYITFTGGDLDLSFGQYIRWDGNVGITRNSVNDMELNAGSVLDIVATGAVEMPIGTNAQRPTGVNGMLRFNTDINEFEGYKSNAWYTLPDGNTTNATLSLETTSPYTLTLTDSAGGIVDVSLLPVANAGVISIDGADGVVTLVEGTGIDITTDTNFNTIEIATTVTDTTYLLQSAAVGSNVDINLNASGTGTDSSIRLVAGGNITLTENAGDITIAASGGAAGVTTLNTLSGDVTISAGTNITLNPVGQDIQISSTDTNTIYSYTAEQVGNDVNLKLNNITDATSDAVKLIAGSNITLTELNDEVTIEADNDDTTYQLSGVVDTGVDGYFQTQLVGTTPSGPVAAGSAILNAGTNIDFTLVNGEAFINASSIGVTSLNGGTGDLNILGGGVTNQQIQISTDTNAGTITIVPVEYQLALNASTLEFRNEGLNTVIDSVNLGSIINDYETNVVSTNDGADIELNIAGGQNVSTVSIIEGTNISIQESGNDTITIAATGLALTLQDVTTNGNTTNVDSEFTSTGYLRIPRGNTGQRPSQVNSELGMIRYNTELDRFEGYGEVGAVGTWLDLSLPDRANDYFTLGSSPDYTLTLFDTEGGETDISLAPLVAAASGVTSIEGLSGVVTLSEGSNVTLTTVGQNIEISATDTDTTYTLSFDTNTDELTLTDGTTPQVVDLSSLAGGVGLQSLNGLSPADGAVSIVAGTNMSLTTDGDDDVTLNCTLTDTTYSLSFNSGTDVLTLTPSTGTADNIDLSSLVGVDTLNGLDGAVTISAGANVTLTTVGNDIEISATGGGGGTVGTLQQVTTQGETTTDEVEFNSTSHIKIPIGSTGQRPSPASTGYFRHNTTTDRPEVYDAEWRQLGTFTGVTSTNADFKFPNGSAQIVEKDVGGTLRLVIEEQAPNSLQYVNIEPSVATLVSSPMTVNSLVPPTNLGLAVGGNQGMAIPVGTTLQRPTSTGGFPVGIIRFNTTTSEFEGKYGLNATDWISFGTSSLQAVMNAGSTATGLSSTVVISTSQSMALIGSNTQVQGLSSLTLTGSSTVTVSTSSGDVTVNSGQDINLNAAGTSKVKLGNYGSGNKTGTPTYGLSVDSQGNIIETAVSTGVVTNNTTLNFVAGSATLNIPNASNGVVVSLLSTGNEILNLAGFTTGANGQATLRLFDLSGNNLSGLRFVHYSYS